MNPPDDLCEVKGCLQPPVFKGFCRGHKVAAKIGILLLRAGMGPIDLQHRVNRAFRRSMAEVGQ